MRPVLVARSLAAVALLVPLSGCALLKDEDPFKIQLFSDMTDDWTGTVIVAEPDGDERFHKTLTLSRASVRTPYHIGELDGTFVFAVESSGRRWEHTTAMTPGSATWTIRVAVGSVCFEFLDDGASDSVCPTPE